MRILVTGMSGTGKSSVLAALDRLGVSTVDTDEPGWCVWSEDEDGWLWDEERMRDLLAGAASTPLVVSGCVSNQGRFYDRFDAVVLLTVPVEVALERIKRRTTNDYGKAADEAGLVREHFAAVEPLLRATATHELDGTRPLAEVVAELFPLLSR